jgi:hypothetical protein
VIIPENLPDDGYYVWAWLSDRRHWDGSGDYQASELLTFKVGEAVTNGGNGGRDEEDIEDPPWWILVLVIVLAIVVLVIVIYIRRRRPEPTDSAPPYVP